MYYKSSWTQGPNSESSRVLFPIKIAYNFEHQPLGRCYKEAMDIATPWDLVIVIYGFLSIIT